jgi:hypothetical protein
VCRLDKERRAYLYFAITQCQHDKISAREPHRSNTNQLAADRTLAIKAEEKGFIWPQPRALCIPDVLCAQFVFLSQLFHLLCELPPRTADLSGFRLKQITKYRKLGFETSTKIRFITFSRPSHK